MKAHNRRKWEKGVGEKREGREIGEERSKGRGRGDNKMKGKSGQLGNSGINNLLVVVSSLVFAN